MTNEEIEIIKIVFQSYLNIVRIFGGADCISEKVVTEVSDKLIKELEQQRWIPVSERLPASDEDVLVTNGRGMYIGWIDPTDKIWRVDSESEYFMYDIVAWRELPQSYKAESEDKG